MGDFFLQEEAPDDDNPDFEDDLPLSEVRKNVVDEFNRQQEVHETRIPTKAEVAANTREMEELLNQCDNFTPGPQGESMINQNHQQQSHVRIPDQGAIIMSNEDFMETPRHPMEQRSLGFTSPQDQGTFIPNQQEVQQQGPIVPPIDPYQSVPGTSSQDVQQQQQQQQFYPNYPDNQQQMFNNPMLADQPMYQIQNNQPQHHYQEPYNAIPSIDTGFQQPATGQMMYEQQADYPNTSMGQSVDQHHQQQIAYPDQYQQQHPVQQGQINQQYPVQQHQQQYQEPQQIQYRRLPDTAQVIHQNNSAHEFLRTPDGRLIRVVRQPPVQRQVVQRLLYNPQTNSYEQVQMMGYPQETYNQAGQRVIRVVPQQQPQMLPASMSQQQQLYQQRQQQVQGQAVASSSASTSQQQALFPVATTQYTNGPSSARSLSFNPPNVRYINPDGTPAEPPMSAYKPELKVPDTEGMPTLETAPIPIRSPIKVIRQPPPRPKPGVPKLVDQKPPVKAPYAYNPPQTSHQPKPETSATKSNGFDGKDHGYASNSSHSAPFAPPKIKPRLPMDRETAELKKTMKAAKESAIKRLSTESGWKMMNGWLKKAKGDDKKTLSLLKELAKADVPVELLVDTTIDTPRYLVSLKKKGNTQVIRDIAGDLVARYKEDVQRFQKEGPKKKEEKETKEPKKEEEMEEEGSPELGEELPEVTKPVQKAPKEEDSKKKEKRAKARVYQSKGRATGFEGNPEEELPEPKPVEKQKPEYQPLHDERKIKKITAPRDSKEKEKEKPKTLDIKKEEKPKTSEKPAAEKKPMVKSPVVPTLSNSFMDAFGPAKAEPVKKKPKRPAPKPGEKEGEPEKKIRSDSTEEPTTPVSENPSQVDINLGGLFADNNTDRREPEIQISGAAVSTERSSIKTVDPAASSLVAPFQGWVTGKKRISFADDVGKELVQIREFEVDETERYNVSHLTPEELIKRDLELEKKCKQDHDTIDDEEDKEKVPSPPDGTTEAEALHPLDPRRELLKANNKAEKKWRLLVVEEHSLTTKERNMFQSQEFFVEQDRQSRTLSVIYDGKLGTIDRSEPTDRPDPEQAPVPIPLMPVESEELPEPEATTSAPTLPIIPTIPTSSEQEHKPFELPSNLKNLLSGLKNAGIISQPTAQHQYQQVDQQGTPMQVQTTQYSSGGSADQPPPHYGGYQPRGGFGGRGRGWPVSRTACQYIMTPRGCTFGEKCRFSHDPKDVERMQLEPYAGGYGRGQPFERGHYSNRPYRGGFHQNRGGS